MGPSLARGGPKGQLARGGRRAAGIVTENRVKLYGKIKGCGGEKDLQNEELSSMINRYTHSGYSL